LFVNQKSEVFLRGEYEANMSTAENLQVAQKGDLLNLRVAGFEPPRAPMDESFPQGRILISPLPLPVFSYFWRDRLGATMAPGNSRQAVSDHGMHCLFAFAPRSCETKDLVASWDLKVRFAILIHNIGTLPLPLWIK
jgi:hypothetical protein